jgi:hypothetical protein
MRRLLLVAALSLPACLQAAVDPCLLKAAELERVLGHLPADGRPDVDPFGTPMCIYETKGETGKRFLLLVHAKPWDAKRYAQRVSLAEGSGLRKVTPLPGVGDAAFYVEGTAGALAGTRYIEINGLRTAARRAVPPPEVGQLLKLSLERLQAR